MVGHEAQTNVAQNTRVLALICHQYCLNIRNTVAAVALDGISNEFVT